MEYYQYLLKVNKLMSAYPELRYGQALVNVLGELNYDLLVRVPQNADPYYDNDKISNFLSFTLEEWYKNENQT